MQKLKKDIVIIAIIIVSLIGYIAIKDVYYTIKIKNEISLSGYNKDKIDEGKLIKDIKAYMYWKEFKYAKFPDWSGAVEKGISPPAYAGKCYGDGYSANEWTGEFYIYGGTVYRAERTCNPLIILIILVMMFIEFVVSIVYVIKKCNLERKGKVGRWKCR